MEKKKRGFAAMDKELNRKISQKGGRAAHQMRRAHTFTRDEAKAAQAKSLEVRRAKAKAQYENGTTLSPSAS